MISVHFQGKPFTITVIQVYTPITNAKKAKGDDFYEDQQDLLELTHTERDALFIIGGWNAKLRNQEIPRITGKLALGYKMEQGKG